MHLLLGRLPDTDRELRILSAGNSAGSVIRRKLCLQTLGSGGDQFGRNTDGKALWFGPE